MVAQGNVCENSIHVVGFSVEKSSSTIYVLYIVHCQKLKPILGSIVLYLSLFIVPISVVAFAIRTQEEPFQ